MLHFGCISSEVLLPTLGDRWLSLCLVLWESICCFLLEQKGNLAYLPILFSIQVPWSSKSKSVIWIMFSYTSNGNVDYVVCENVYNVNCLIQNKQIFLLAFKIPFNERWSKVRSKVNMSRTQKSLLHSHPLLSAYQKFQILKNSIKIK